MAGILVFKHGKTTNSNESVPPKLISFIFLQILKVSQFNLKSFCKHYTFPSQSKRIYSYFPFHQTKMRYLCLYYIFQQLESVYIFVMYRNRVIYLINEVYYMISLYHRTLSQDICHEACSLLYAWRNGDTSAWVGNN